MKKTIHNIGLYDNEVPTNIFFNLSLENLLFAYAKTMAQISCEFTTQLISAFVFATVIVQFLYFLNPKVQAFSHLLWLCSPVCVGPSRKP